MTTVRIIQGDSLDVLWQLEPDSIDAICTDPPYGLEFMGKGWDKFRPDETRVSKRWDGERAGAQGTIKPRGGIASFGALATPAYGGHRPTTSRCSGCQKRDAFRNAHECTPDAEWKLEQVTPNAAPPSMLAFQEWTHRWALAAYRVLKPGGHLLAFGGTRTYHRLAAGLEDAGFEIRDTLAWMYGCLDEESDVLTAEGWKRGVDVGVGDLVAAWDADTGEVALRPVLEKFLAPYEGDLVRLKNDDTDQRLTPNHRVYKRHAVRRTVDGVRSSALERAWEVSEAGDLNRWQPVRLPLAGTHDGPGIGGVDYAALLGWVWTEGGFDTAGTGVRLYQSSVNDDRVREIVALLGRWVPTARHYERERTYRDRAYVEHTWYWSGLPAERVRSDLPDKHPTYDLLWRMTLDEKRAFLRAALAGDGNRVGTAFYQKDDGDREWFQTLLHVVGKAGRDNPRKRVVSIRNGATTELQARHLKRYDREAYDGNVWCVRVETGAFVARRRGRVFLTGNSGFPKSHDVSKALDKAAGVERPDREVAAPAENKVFQPTQTVVNKGTPVTEEARRWEGWGTALKPAHEPIVVARKPLIGTVAANVLQYGTGGINVNASRVGTDGGTRKEAPEKRESVSAYGDGLNGGGVAPLDAGRWPANVLLGCTCVETIPGEPEEATERVDDRRYTDRGSTNFAATPGRIVRTGGTAEVHTDPDCPCAQVDAQSDSGGASRFFMHAQYSEGEGAEWTPETANGAEMREPTDITMTTEGPSTSDGFVEPAPSGIMLTSGLGVSRFMYHAKTSKSEREKGLDDSAAGKLHRTNAGGYEADPKWAPVERKNTHPTVKPIALMRWLVRLVTPEGGVVLDPFLGSGTTAIAAGLAGFHVIGIEREAEYVEISALRVAHWVPGAVVMVETSDPPELAAYHDHEDEDEGAA